MSKDPINNILFMLGVIGSIIVVGINTYYLLSSFFASPFSNEILGWVSIFSIFLIALALLGIHRETTHFIPLIAMISFLVLVILNTLERLDILGPSLFFFLAIGLANMVYSWLIWIISLVAIWLLGYSMWITREWVGNFAVIAGVVLIISGITLLILRFLNYGLGATFYNLLICVRGIIVYILISIYFIMAIRN